MGQEQQADGDGIRLGPFHQRGGPGGGGAGARDPGMVKRRLQQARITAIHQQSPTA